MVLLVAIVVIAVTVLTASTLLVRSATDRPQADVTANVTETRVMVNHTGGDTLEASRVSVVVRGDGTEFRTSLEPADINTGDGDERLEPGEGAQVLADDFAPGARVRAMVVHANRTVLLDSRLVVAHD